MNGNDYSKDSFQKGRFWLTQPLKKGHRCGMDALFLAATLPSDFSGRLADFGAGAGAAGLSVASRCERAHVVLVENIPEMLFCAQETLEDPRNSSFVNRVDILDVDLALTGQERSVQGLENNSFDCVIMNPPFNPSASTLSPDLIKRMAHAMTPNLPELWMRNASAVIKSKGTISLITRPEALIEFLNAMNRRFGGAKILPIYSRKNKPAIRFIVSAIRDVRTPCVFLPPLVLYEGSTDKLTHYAQSIHDGHRTLFQLDDL